MRTPPAANCSCATGRLHPLPISSTGVRYSSLLSPSVTRTAHPFEHNSGQTTQSSLARLSALSIALSVFSRIMPPWLLNCAPTTRSKLKYGIGAPCQVPTARSLAESGEVPLLQLCCGNLIVVACCVSVPQPHHRVHTSRRDTSE